MSNIRNVFFTALLALCTFGCSNKQQKIMEQQRIDSIAQIEKNKQDSIEKIRIDSLAQIAWGDAKFGMSIEEALKTNAFKGSTVSDYEDGQILTLPTEKTYIGSSNIDVQYFRVFFKMNELCHIFIKSYSKSADYINDLESDALSIAKKFEKKYGEATESLNRKVSIIDFDGDRPIYLKEWNFRYDKTIFIELCQEKHKYKYYYQISIFGWKYPIKKNIEKAKQNAKKQEEREKLEKYQF